MGGGFQASSHGGVLLLEEHLAGEVPGGAVKGVGGGKGSGGIGSGGGKGSEAGGDPVFQGDAVGVPGAGVKDGEGGAGLGGEGVGGGGRGAMVMGKGANGVVEGEHGLVVALGGDLIGDGPVCGRIGCAHRGEL